MDGSGANSKLLKTACKEYINMVNGVEGRVVHVNLDNAGAHLDLQITGKVEYFFQNRSKNNLGIVRKFVRFTPRRRQNKRTNLTKCLRCFKCWGSLLPKEMCWKATTDQEDEINEEARGLISSPRKGCHFDTDLLSFMNYSEVSILDSSELTREVKLWRAYLMIDKASQKSSYNKGDLKFLLPAVVCLRMHEEFSKMIPLVDDDAIMKERFLNMTALEWARSNKHIQNDHYFLINILNWGRKYVEHRSGFNLIKEQWKEILSEEFNMIYEEGQDWKTILLWCAAITNQVVITRQFLLEEHISPFVLDKMKPTQLMDKEYTKTIREVLENESRRKQVIMLLGHFTKCGSELCIEDNNEINRDILISLLNLYKKYIKTNSEPGEDSGATEHAGVNQPIPVNEPFDPAIEMMDQFDDLQCLQCLLPAAARLEMRNDFVEMLSRIDDSHLGSHEIIQSKLMGRTALGWAIQNEDNHILIELLKWEKRQHPKEIDGLRCIKEQVASSPMLAPNSPMLQFTNYQLSKLYPSGQNWCDGILAVLLILPGISFILGDSVADIRQSYEFYKSSSLYLNGQPGNDILWSPKNVSASCANFSFERLPEDYTVAFWANNIFMLAPFLMSLLINGYFISGQIRIIRGTVKGIAQKILWSIFTWLFMIVLYAVTCVLLLANDYVEQDTFWRYLFPVFVISIENFLIVKRIYWTFKNKSTNETKSDVAVKLWVCEYMITMSKALEVGWESSGEVLLQLWILSVAQTRLQEMEVLNVLRWSILGFFHHLLLGGLIIPANEVQKRLGKLLYSIIMLVKSVGYCYSTLKRAIDFKDMVCYYLSILTQVLARVIAFGLAFSASPTEYHGLMIGLLCWFLIRTAIIKWITTFKSMLSNEFWNRHRWMAWDIIGTLSSSLIYIDVNKEKKETFWSNFIYWFVALCENLVLAILPWVLSGKDNRAYWCLPKQYLHSALAFVIVLQLCSGIFLVIFYKFYGHPSKLINGTTTFRKVNGFLIWIMETMPNWAQEHDEHLADWASGHEGNNSGPGVPTLDSIEEGEPASETGESTRPVSTRLGCPSFT